MQRRLFAEEIEARLDALLLLSLRQRSGKRAASVLERLPRAQQDAVLHWVGVAAQTSTELGVWIAEAAAHRLADLDAWMQAVLAAFDAGGLDAAQAVSFGSGDQGGVSLADMEGRVSLLLHALTGRSVVLASMPGAMGSDGETYWLPERIATFPAVAANQRAYLGLAAWLWARHRYGERADAATCLRNELPGLADAIAALGDIPFALLTPNPSGAPQSRATKAPQLLRAVGGAGQAQDAQYAPMAGDADAVHSSDETPIQVTDAREEAKTALPVDAPPGDQAAGPGTWSPVTAGRDSAADDDHGRPDAMYDEWDYRRQSWRRNWCHLYEHDVPLGDADWVAAVRQRHAASIRAVRRRFETLRPEQRLLRRQLDGDEIDIDAHIEARSDRRSGGEPSPRLYQRHQRLSRSLAVMFMIDMSGSTKGWVNDAERESLVLLCEAVDALGDPYAIYGFSGWTRTRCDIYLVKRFDQRYDADVRRRIAGIEARDYTRMGVAVRHLSRLLAQQDARHKLLITISDGRPDDHGDEYRGRYGIEDTRHALHEAREQGIRSYCITIDRHGADYLPQLYGSAHYAVVDDARKLPQKIAAIYRRLVS